MVQVKSIETLRMFQRYSSFSSDEGMLSFQTHRFQTAEMLFVNGQQVHVYYGRFRYYFDLIQKPNGLHKKCTHS